MSTLNIWQNLGVLRLGLSVILGLTFLIGLLLTTSAIHPPDVAQAQVSTISGMLTNIVQVTTEEGVTSIYTETSTAQVPLAQGSFTTFVVITPTAISHKFYGPGVHNFDADYRTPNFTDTSDLTSTLDFTSSLAALGIKYLRVPFGPDWDHKNIPAPPACSDATYVTESLSMYTFISENFAGDYTIRLTNAISISNIAQNLGIEIILLNWRAHKTWLTDPTYKELKDEYVDDYACFVVQVARYLTDEGVKISYLEPTNEPSDTHDTKIPPEPYNTFVKFLRTLVSGN